MIVRRTIKRTLTKGLTGRMKCCLILLQGIGDTGESFTINATQTTLCQTMELVEDGVLVMATTVKAVKVLWMAAHDTAPRKV